MNSNLVSNLTGKENPGETNDLSITPQGGIFFTSPIWDGKGDIYFLSPEKKLKILVSQIKGFPNGIEFDYQDKYLYVAMTQLNQIWKYSVDYKMDLQFMSIFAHITTPDGMVFDEFGNLWVASYQDATIVVLDPRGKKIGDIVVDNQSVQNCCFGGPENNILYIAARTAVYSLKINIKGR